MQESWLIIGCGYVGERLAARLITAGHQVSATRSSAEASAALQARVPGLRATPYRLGEATMALPKQGYVVLSVPPGPRAPAEETAFAGRLRADVRLVYLSTTGVYADADGGEVSDEYPLRPASERGARRLAVETALQAVHANHVCLRIPGIYGPGRGVHKRMQEGSYRLIGDGLSVVSRIHVDDLTCAIEVVARSSEISRCGVVVGDDEPCSTYEHAMGVAHRLGLPAPPQVDPMSVSADVRAMLSAGRRVVPATLRALGWRPQFPSWREGLEHCLAEESAVPNTPD